ncbi:MAG: dihydrodipicolinate synthase family protein [Verrucomicrobia bacterium]|nr:dihydrodipicolinate synthase family protein [Verrucomicrobiota bacterium]MDA1068863.1 dihydrodipicolinate synthase family protein [Verrucomicrobiota bacterium]
MSSDFPTNIRTRLSKGCAIPAHPLALNKERKLDERRQRALSRYYLDAGVGGLAVGVHTTQFEIRKSEIGLYKPVLALAKEEIDAYEARSGRKIARIAGVVGLTKQAVEEAALAAELGYDAGLLSLTAFPDASNDELIEHCRAVAEILPVFGFYIQPAVGGRFLGVDFWRKFSKIENVVAIKAAPFDRYKTFDVVRGVVESGRSEDIALYTGNDDNILNDLLTEFEVSLNGVPVKKRIVGGLLGHWSVWTKRAVELVEKVQSGAFDPLGIEGHILGNKITDSNAAFFDAANGFAGCIVGLHEVLRRQGLLEGVWTLNQNEELSPKQKDEIDRVYAAYPELSDDAFVAENLDRWLS